MWRKKEERGKRKEGGVRVFWEVQLLFHMFLTGGDGVNGEEAARSVACRSRISIMHRQSERGGGGRGEKYERIHPTAVRRGTHLLNRSPRGQKKKKRGGGGRRKAKKASVINLEGFSLSWSLSSKKKGQRWTTLLADASLFSRLRVLERGKKKRERKKNDSQTLEPLTLILLV